jgi:spore germination protein GerM
MTEEAIRQDIGRITNVKHKHLLKLITDILCNPNFISYIADNIPENTSVLEAVKMYIGRPKEHKNKIDKSLQVLEGYGYHIIQ